VTTVDLRLGDCLKILPTLPVASVDMIFADPPFNIGKKYSGRNNNNDNRSDYYEWCASWISEGFRVLKSTGTFYLMTIARHVFQMGYEMEKHGVFINKIEWRNVSASHSKRGFWPSTQSILAFGKTDGYKFNTYAQRRKIAKMNLRWGGYSTEPQGQLLDYWDDIPFIYAGSVAHPEAILKSGTNEKAHPTQMPINLAVRCILFSTDKGDIVLDPFFGSGTTLVACLKTGRNSIGIEVAPAYFAIAEKRISDAQRQMVMEI